MIETTVPPGTCQNIVKPIVLTEIKKRGIKNQTVKIGHSYERVMPGPDYINSIKNFYRVYSGIDKQSEIETKKFLKTVISTNKFPLTKLSNTNATEIAKVLENSYRAMNIAFMVEWSRFSEEASVNLYEIIDAIRMRPTHSNIMYPGLGVGGYCLTKDSLLASWSKQNIIGNEKALFLSENAVSINDQMPRFAFNFIKSFTPNLLNLNILFMGVSYRGDVGDTRSTPVEKLYEFIHSEGGKIFLHDPYIEFWQEKKINVINELFYFKNKKINIIIITAAHSYYTSEKVVNFLFNLDKLIIFDTIGHFSEDQLLLLQSKHTIKVLGRGDI